LLRCQSDDTVQECRRVAQDRTAAFVQVYPNRPAAAVEFDDIKVSFVTFLLSDSIGCIGFGKGGSFGCCLLSSQSVRFGFGFCGLACCGGFSSAALGGFRLQQISKRQ